MFVRTDLPVAQQIVQSNHAVFHFASLRCPGFEQTPNIVVIGVPNLAALLRVDNKLKANHIPHYCWHEPDFDYGFTSIAAGPLQGEERQALANYRIYNASGVLVASTSVSNTESLGSIPNGRANAGECADASSARV